MGKVLRCTRKVPRKTKEPFISSQDDPINSLVEEAGPEHQYDMEQSDSTGLPHRHLDTDDKGTPILAEIRFDHRLSELDRKNTIP